MINRTDLLEGYENMKFVHYGELDKQGIKTVKFSDLHNHAFDGALKASFYDSHGELVQQFTEYGNHVLCIAATRLGKTSGYVIPTVLSFAEQKVKKSMVITDPKGEIYRLTAARLKEKGYNVKLLNFRDYRHSEFWNPLTKIFRKYQRATEVYKEVEMVEVDGKCYNKFNGRIYTDQLLLDRDIENERNDLLDDVYNDIDLLSNQMISPKSQKDPTWELGARDILRAFLHAMLEDSKAEENPITEDTFSIKTIFDILATFSEENDDYDNGYFSDRDKNSHAYMLAKDILLISAKVTRMGYVSTFNTSMSSYREIVTRKITSCNSFEFSELIDTPTALFISFRDEVKAQYSTIALFVQDMYEYLIERAGRNANGKLSVPFYFILDEFGNFTKITDFDTTISACAGRNIWFILIVQSFAQLYNVYGKDVAEIIRDNLNLHVMLGSNNPNTLKEFSEECGSFTRISPLSALNSKGMEIDTYSIETIPLVTKSRLSRFESGECIITEANCGYVMLSKLERYYLCKEFNVLTESHDGDYKPASGEACGNTFYNYVRKEKKNRNDWF